MKTFVTETGMRKMEDELSNLKGKEMRQILQYLTEAREKGDISENSEYDAAKESLDMLNIRIRSLESKMRNAMIIYKENVTTDTIQILTTAAVKNLKTNKEMLFTISPENEVDIKLGKISHNSPIAKGLVGRKIGDRVKIDIPSGQIEFEVLNITI